MISRVVQYATETDPPKVTCSYIPMLMIITQRTDHGKTWLSWLLTRVDTRDFSFRETKKTTEMFNVCPVHVATIAVRGADRGH
jgi:hypothetical protein